MRNYDKLFIDGQWVPARGGHFLEVLNASTEQVMGRIPVGSAADIDAAVGAARAAFPGWAATTAAQRAAFLQRLVRGLLDRADEIAQVITGEVGMPLKLSQRIQAGLPVAVMESYAKLVTEYPFEEELGNSLVLREAVGVVGCITPWNFPLHQIVAKLAPALAAGCTVVLKPSEIAPLNAFILAEIVEQAGLPPGVFNLVSGTGPEAGEALARHPGVDMISFTGSTRAGKRVSELAAQTVKRVALELGGKSAAIILDDADLPAAVKGTVNSCFLNSGQTCTALTRMLVPESRYQEVAQLTVETAQAFTVGDPFGHQAKLGPLISDAQRQRVRDYIRRGLEEGAELLLGGPEPPEGLAKGYFVRPTVFGRVAPTSTIAQEEIFGPVLAILTYRDEEEAIRIANDSVYGLAGAIWAGDQDHALRIARRIRAGQIDINGGRFNLLAPFGGFKQSGLGREFGKYGLEEFLEIKSLQR
jgi:acyl-CoA reductase-like NAD-dependent aldehyde dehydrogenase